MFNESKTLDLSLYRLCALAQRFIHLLNSKSTPELSNTCYVLLNFIPRGHDHRSKIVLFLSYIQIFYRIFYRIFESSKINS